MDYGSVADWFNVLIALIAMGGFIIVEHERLLAWLNRTARQRTSEQKENRLNQDSQITPDIEEYDVDLRAKIYSLILVGVIFGLAASEAFFWITSRFYEIEGYEAVTSLIFSILLSTIFSILNLRYSRTLVSVFVHWVERLAASYFCLVFILINDYYVYSGKDSTTISYSTTFVVIVHIVIFLLIGFPTTPIDWIITVIKRLTKRK